MISKSYIGQGVFIPAKNMKKTTLLRSVQHGMYDKQPPERPDLTRKLGRRKKLKPGKKSRVWNYNDVQRIPEFMRTGDKTGLWYNKHPASPEPQYDRVLTRWARGHNKPKRSNGVLGSLRPRKPFDLEAERQKKVSKIAPRIVYHGTNSKSAKRILEEGFRSKSQPTNFPEQRAMRPYPKRVESKVFASPELGMAERYADHATRAKGKGKPAVLKIRHVGPVDRWKEDTDTVSAITERVIKPKDVLGMRRIKPRKLTSIKHNREMLDLVDSIDNIDNRVSKLAPRVLYHGTTHRNANKILKEGFNPRGKEGFPTVRAFTPYPEDVKDKVFTSPDKQYARRFAQYRAYAMHEGAPARIKMTHVGPRTNWREVDNPEIRQKEYIVDPKDIINMKRDGVRQEWVNRGALGAGAAGVGGYQYKKHRERKKVQKALTTEKIKRRTLGASAALAGGAIATGVAARRAPQLTRVAGGMGGLSATTGIAGLAMPRPHNRVQKGIGAAILKPLSSPAKGATPKMAQALKPKMPKALTPPKMSTGVTMPKPNIKKSLDYGKSEVSKAGRYANTANPASLASDRQGRHVGGNPFDFREANARAGAFQGNFSAAAKPGRHAAANPAFNAPDRKGRHVGGNPFDFREANARSAAFNPQAAPKRGGFLKPLMSLGRKVLRKSDEVEKGIGTAAKLMSFKPIVPKISTEGAASMAGRARAKMNANPARSMLKPPANGPRHRADGSGIKMPNLTTAAAGAGGLAMGAGGAALYNRKHQN